MPIGNVTSQIFSYIYLDIPDQYIKHKLKIKYYFRYADDFIILSRDINFLKSLTLKIQEFLEVNLTLSLHPRKVAIRPLMLGLDFLGYTVMPMYRNVRSKTKKRMWKKLRQAQDLYDNDKISAEQVMQILNSYLAMLSHANANKLSDQIKNVYTIAKD